MTPDHRRETATIIEFPVRRAPKPGFGRPQGGLPSSSIPSPMPTSTGAWYHEAALKELEPARRN